MLLRLEAIVNRSLIELARFFHEQRILCTSLRDFYSDIKLRKCFQGQHSGHCISTSLSYACYTAQKVRQDVLFLSGRSLHDETHNPHSLRKSRKRCDCIVIC